MTDFNNVEIGHKKTELIEAKGHALFTEIFEHSPVGLVLVDEDTFLYRANKFIFSYFNMDQIDVFKEKFGNAFRCSVVEGQDKICGEADGCKNCALRGGVTAVLKDLITIENHLLDHEFIMKGRRTTKYFQISASPVKHDDVTYALVTFVDVTNRIMNEKKLEMLGLTDDLTNLNNRRFIDRVLSYLLKEKEHEKLNVGLIDIDDFKHVNDTFGHPVGDEVLKELSRTVEECLRSTDYSARFGGEEFIIVLPDVSQKNAIKVIDRLRRKFKARSKEIVGYEVSFSCGLALIGEKDHFTPEQVYKMSDDLLYTAKKEGKDRTVVFED